MGFLEMLGLGLAIIVSIVTITIPLVKVVSTVTKLIVTIETLTDSFNKHQEGNVAEMDKLWEHEDKQDIILTEHEQRIGRIELGRN